jgi:predicted MFS family arabinose efflux permease
MLAGVRRLLLLVSSIIFVDAMLFTALTPLIPGYAHEFGLSKAQAGLLVGAFGAGALLGGIPGGVIAARLGPKRAVAGGLVLLALSSFAFAAADTAFLLGAARFVQGLSSTTTWAGALGWAAVGSRRDQRGQILGIVFGAAVAGAVLGPMFGGVADAVGIRLSFIVVGAVALGFAALASVAKGVREEPASAGSLGRALRDPRFIGGLWLNALPALLFGILVVLAPLALDRHGWSPLSIALVFFAAGAVEVVINPLLGRASDRVGPLLPTRVALCTSVVVAAALAAASAPILIAVLVTVASISFGGFYTPGMALTSHRAEAAGVRQGVAFGIMNSAWALGNVTGPTASGALAQSFGDAVPYVGGAVLCALTLVATLGIAPERTRARAA